MNYPIIVPEIGINHNGDIRIAKSLISLVSNLGLNYIKFQKKTPDLCVPETQKDIIKDTIFGPMKYIDYKKKMEFGKEEYDEIDRYCTLIKMRWFASCWDEPSVEFISKYEDIPFIKIPSACITDLNLLQKIRNTDIPTILSTGMSTENEINDAISILDGKLQYILHTTSSYPTPFSEMNMNKIYTLKKLYGDRYKIGFSNHSPAIIFSVMSYVMGAEMIEFHITLDRHMNGTDQSSSIGPTGFIRILNHIDNISRGFGNGNIELQPSELEIKEKLRK